MIDSTYHAASALMATHASKVPIASGSKRPCQPLSEAKPAIGIFKRILMLSTLATAFARGIAPDKPGLGTNTLSVPLVPLMPSDSPQYANVSTLAILPASYNLAHATSVSELGAPEQAVQTFATACVEANYVLHLPDGLNAVINWGQSIQMPSAMGAVKRFIDAHEELPAEAFVDPADERRFSTFYVDACKPYFWLVQGALAPSSQDFPPSLAPAPSLTDLAPSLAPWAAAAPQA